MNPSPNEKRGMPFGVYHTNFGHHGISTQLTFSSIGSSNRMIGGMTER